MTEINFEQEIKLLKNQIEQLTIRQEIESLKKGLNASVEMMTERVEEIINSQFNDSKSTLGQIGEIKNRVEEIEKTIKAVLDTVSMCINSLQRK